MPFRQQINEAVQLTVHTGWPFNKYFTTNLVLRFFAPLKVSL
jgi:hypothetical protein